MAEQHDYKALDWVRDEIEETLKQARQSLEAYLADPDDSTRMRFCVTHLHQVAGTLQMVEFYGAALLAEEMENLAVALMNGKVQRMEDSQEVLMRAIIQLPAYLDSIKDGRRDIAVVVLPLLNDLRAARDEPLLSETALFKPDLESGQEAAPSQIVPQETLTQLPQLLKKIRQLYQFALVGMIRNQDMPANLGYMVKSLTKLEQLYSGTPMAQLWWVAVGLAEGVSRSYIDLGTSVKMLLGQLDRQLKICIDEGGSRSQLPPRELLKNLLYYVARSEGSTNRIEDIREAFKLDGALPPDELLDNERQLISGPDRGTMVSVVDALVEEMAIIKEQINAYMDGGNVGGLRQVIPELKQIADTLAVLGVGNARRVILEQVDVIGHLLNDGEDSDDNVLMDVAGALLYVEATLTGMIRDPAGAAAAHERDDETLNVTSIPKDQLSSARMAVVDECRAGLETAKEAIAKYSTHQFDLSYLAPVPETLNAVRGGLMMVPLTLPAVLLQSCLNYIQDNLNQPNSHPEWEQLEQLADAISSIDYYLECLDERLPEKDEVLAIATKAVTNLGYPPQNVNLQEMEPPTLAATTSRPAPPKQVVEPEIEPEIEPLPDVMVDSQLEAESAIDSAAESELSNEMGQELSGQQEFSEEQEPPTLDYDYSPEDSVDWEAPTELNVDFELESDDAGIPVPELDQVPSPLQELEPEPEDEPIDEELLEIFVEEAGEVLETINEYLPRWRADHDDEEALKELRRAYHTLKGSGRMVSAMVIGELSWSIENMLNRVLDHSIATTEATTGIVTQVTNLMPQLVAAFENRVKPAIDVAPYAAVADALAKGENPPPLPGDSAVVAEVPILVESMEDNEEAEAFELIVEDDSGESDLEIDPVLVDIFGQEAASHIETIKDYLQYDISDGFSENMLRALHTLKGSAHMAGIGPIAELATPIERFFKECHLQGVKAGADVRLLLEDFVNLIETSLVDLKIHPVAEIVGVEELLVRLAELRTEKLSHQEEDNGAVASSETLQVFLAEGMDLVSDSGDDLRQWERDPVSGAQLDRLTQNLRILARGASAADFPEIVALALTLEELYNSAAQGMISPNEEFFHVAHQAHEELVNMMDFAAAGQPITSTKDFISELQHLMDDAPEVSQQIAQAERHQEAVTEAKSNEDVESGAVPESQTPDLEPLPSAEAERKETYVQEPEPQATHIQEYEQNEPEQDTEFLEAGFEQAESEFEETLDSEFAWQEDSERQENQETFAAFDADGFIEDGFELEDFDTADEADEDATADTEAPTAPATPVVASTEDEEYDQELVEIFLEEASEILDSIGEELENWIQQPDDLDLVVGLQRSLHTLKGGARMSEIKAMGDLSHHLENLYEGASLGRITTNQYLFDLLHDCHDRLAQMYSDIEAGKNPVEAEDLIKAIDDFVSGREQAVSSPVQEPMEAAQIPELAEAESSEHADSVEPETEDQVEIEPDQLPVLKQTDSDALEALGQQGNDDIDVEILEIFLEEADELTEGIDNTIDAWLSERDNPEHLDEMKRLLHTLKGGARLAGMTQIGDLSHHFETFLIDAENNQAPWDDGFFARIQQDHDQLIDLMERLRQQGGALINAASHGAEKQANPESRQSGVEHPTVQDTKPSADKVDAAVVPLKPSQTAVKPPQSVPKPLVAAKLPESGMHADEGKRANTESVKVSADLMEGLVNLAGETSIFRGRIEQEITDFNFVIDEIGMTIERARELLRRMDIETEAQILHRYQQAQTEGMVYEEFDPLEMDRYSSLNQISRSLGETVSDLNDLKDSLLDRARDAETLLVQQGRINSELQESLMRTRMVPFSRMVPRLRRIVRQVAGELGKKAELEIFGADGEMDRTVLERMVAPLEHMLRNAVDHGLEAPEQRVAAGKNAAGRITIHLSREGGEVVLRLSDDGKGVNLAGVRKRAIERGLMKEDSSLPDKEIMQFIFKQGFSTAEKVTQISGRGVGMDVVHSEIKQLGGNVRLHSAQGSGSQFTIRLPFTVSVNRALMVRVADDLYAIPLNNIEGIVRVSPYELEAYYEPDAPPFEYAGQQYDVRYLGRYVHNTPAPNLMGQSKPLPVLLVRSAERAVALQVDSLLGSKEIVVKSVGPQLAAVSGISGATILGDGSVVIIVDVNAVIRAEQALVGADLKHDALATRLNETPIVMVVDDSVTVRKVTSRLLERHGFEVVTAKDGVDAITQLQDIKPDVMLLDIEMPRMDGFEVATLVRHDDRLRNLPIIMITSRTGEKHRDRAMGIGVDRYMGKPYQESELLETIETLLTRVH